MRALEKLLLRAGCSLVMPMKYLEVIQWMTEATVSSLHLQTEVKEKENEAV